MDIHTNVGEVHLSSCCRDRVRPFLQQCHARIFSARVSCGCSGWFSVSCCFFRSVARVRWHLLRLLEKWLQSEAGWVPDIWSAFPEAMPAKVSYSLFGSLDPFSKTEIIVTRLKRAEHRDWMMSRSGFRRAIITVELSMPSFLEVVSNIVSMSPLIGVYLKGTRRRADGDNLVVYYILLFHSSCIFFHMLILLFCFRRRKSMPIFLTTRWREANFTCFTWLPKYVRLASYTILSGSRWYVCIP